MMRFMGICFAGWIATFHALEALRESNDFGLVTVPSALAFDYTYVQPRSDESMVERTYRDIAGPLFGKSRWWWEMLPSAEEMSSFRGSELTSRALL